MCFQIQPRLWVNTSSSLVFYCFAIFCNCAENFAVKNLFNMLPCFLCVTRSKSTPFTWFGRRFSYWFTKNIVLWAKPITDHLLQIDEYCVCNVLQCLDWGILCFLQAQQFTLITLFVALWTQNFCPVTLPLLCHAASPAWPLMQVTAMYSLRCYIGCLHPAFQNFITYICTGCEYEFMHRWFVGPSPHTPGIWIYIMLMHDPWLQRGTKNILSAIDYQEICLNRVSGFDVKVSQCGRRTVYS